MPIDNQLWRARIGINNSNQLHHFTNLKITPENLDIFFIFKFSNFCMITVFLVLLTYLSVYLILTQAHSYGFNINAFNIANVLLTKYFDFCCYGFNLKRLLLLQSGDIITNLRPRKFLLNFFTGTYKYLCTMPLIEAFITTHNFDTICLLETFLDSSIDISDIKININGYSLLRADHPSNTKRGGVCMYYKNYLPVIRRTGLSDLRESVVAEITVDKEKCFLTNLYRLPSQNDDEFETFYSDLIFLLNNINKFQPSYSVLLRDFNVKHSKCYSSDKNNKSGTVLENIASTAG